MTRSSPIRPDSNLEQLCLDAQPQLTAVLRQTRVPAVDAEDLLQECFLRFLTLPYEVRDPIGWLSSAIRFAAKLYWRARHSHELDWFEPELAASLAVEQPDTDFHRDLLRFFRRLPGGSREILHLRYALGLAPIEIADRIGCTTRNVRKRTYTARRQLAALLTRNGYGPGQRSTTPPANSNLASSP